MFEGIAQCHIIPLSEISLGFFCFMCISVIRYRCGVVKRDGERGRGVEGLVTGC